MNRRERISVVAMDLDGVIYNGDRACERAAETVAKIRADGYRIFFLTNNSGRTRIEIAAKLERFSIPVKPDEIGTSAMASGLFLKQYMQRETECRVKVIGSAGLATEIAAICPSAKLVTSGKKCDVLVVGFTKNVDYAIIQEGLDSLLGGAFFLACNKDCNFPGEEGRRLPGCGAIVGAIAGAIGRDPDAVAGKPHSLLLKWVCAAANCQPSEILVVGDSTASDIHMANSVGSKSVLISLEPSSFTGMGKPTVVMRSIRALPKWLNSLEK